LRGIAAGEWSEPVMRVRELPADSPEQKAAKLKLPYCTWAGEFTRRENTGLVKHSGQVGIDLDSLGEAGAIAVLQSAVADRFCLAAFRSARGEGVRLIIRIPPCSPENHAAAFGEVAEHVRNTYGREPDKSGRDASRASFVSFDHGLWFNRSAAVLPIILPDDTQRYIPLCVTRCVSPHGLEDWAHWYGRHYGSITQRENGTAKTHRNLLDLGLALAMHAERIHTLLTARQVDTALAAWLAEHQRQDVQLRCAPADYRAELQSSVDGARRKPWFKTAAEKWIRWSHHLEFPRSGHAAEQILFAIRQHCAEGNTTEFFLSARDAGLVAGVSFATAARMLRELVAARHLEKVGTRKLARHAQAYRLRT
jgi:hypothetical protein